MLKLSYRYRWITMTQRVFKLIAERRILLNTTNNSSGAKVALWVQVPDLKGQTEKDHRYSDSIRVISAESARAWTTL